MITPEIWQHEFIQNALWGSLLLSISCGLIGTLIITNRLVFLSGGIAHSAYGGVGLAWYLGWPILTGVLVFIIPIAALLGWLHHRIGERADTIVNVSWAAGMAIGVVLLDLSPGYKANLMSYLFGSIMTITRLDLYFMLGLCIFILITIILFYHPMLSVSIDAEFAQTRGVPVLFIRVLIPVLIALGVVLMMRLTGLILMIALLSIPASIARQYARSWPGLILLAFTITQILCVTGIVISYYSNLGSSALIILLATILYFLHLMLQQFRKVRSSQKISLSLNPNK